MITREWPWHGGMRGWFWPASSAYTWWVREGSDGLFHTMRHTSTAQIPRGPGQPTKEDAFIQAVALEVGDLRKRGLVKRAEHFLRAAGADVNKVLVMMDQLYEGGALSNPTLTPTLVQNWWVQAFTAWYEAEEKVERLPVKLQRIDGPFVVRAELWSEECLWRGVGDWEEQGVATTRDERLYQYEEEFELRCQLPSWDRDAKPKDAGKLLISEWRPLPQPLIRPPFVYEMAQLSVWERR